MNLTFGCRAKSVACKAGSYPPTSARSGLPLRSANPMDMDPNRRRSFLRCRCQPKSRVVLTVTTILRVGQHISVDMDGRNISAQEAGDRHGGRSARCYAVSVMRMFRLRLGLFLALLPIFTFSSDDISGYRYIGTAMIMRYKALGYKNDTSTTKNPDESKTQYLNKGEHE